MPNDKDVAKAVEWCNQARKILKIRHKKKTERDEKAGGFQNLGTYLERVKFGLSELKAKGHKDYAALAQEFVERAKLGQKAKETGNQELANLLLDNLILLDTKIQIALNRRHTDTTFENLQKSLKLKETKQYETALKNAQNILLGLEGISQPPHLFTGEASTHIGTAKVHHENDRLALALERLGYVPVEEAKERERYRAFTKYGDKLAESRDYEERLKLFDEAQRTKTAEPVTKLIAEAVQIADTTFAYEDAYKKLKPVHKAYTNALGTLKKPELKAFEEFRKARKSFEEMYLVERNRINEARSLRGMTNGKPKEFLDEAEQLLAAARRNVDRLSDPEDIKRQELLLVKIKPQVEKAIEESKNAKGDSQENLKAMTRWFELLKLVERDQELLRSLRGTEAEQNELGQLLATAKFQLRPGDGEGLSSTQLLIGYPAAVAVLEEYAKIVDRARKASEERLNSEFPKTVTEAIVKVLKALRAFDEHAPTFVVEVQIDELNTLEDHIRTSLFKAKEVSNEEYEKAAKTAVEQCGKLETYVLEETKILIEDQRQARILLQKYVDEQARLTKAGMPIGMLASAERLVGIATETDVPDREWRRALTKADNALRILIEVEKVFNKHWEAWQKTKTRLDLFRDLARSLLNWPPLGPPARQLLDDGNEVQTVFEKTFDFEATALLFKELILETQYKTLSELKQRQNVPGKDEVDLLAETLRIATRNVREKGAALTDYLIPTMERLLTGLGEPRVNEMRTRAEALLKDWEDYRLYPDTDPKNINKTAERAIQDLEKVRVEVQGIIDDPKTKLPELIKKLQGEEERRYADKLPDFIREQISKLDSDTSRKQLRQALDSVVYSDRTPEKMTEALKIVRDSVLVALDKERKVANKKFDEQNEVAEEVTKSLSEIKGRHSNFQAYQERLEKEVLDAKTMIASGDPDLLELARKSLLDIKRRVSEVHPDQRGPKALHYSAAENVHARLAEKLGRTLVLKGSILIENRLPNTYKRLSAKLNETWLKASNMSPAEAEYTLRGLEAEIDTAWTEALLLNDEHERFKERKKRFESAWTKLKEKTRKNVTDKPKNIELYVESQLKYADGQRHTESGLPDAYKTLIALETEVLKLLATPDKDDMREGVLKWDAQCFKNQELVRDMARQFKVELDHFKETLLKETKERIEANLKKGLIQEVDAKDSIKIVDNLKKQASAAGKIVKPYLANLETLPHERIGADESPSVEKAKADFKSARDLLYKGRLTAERLASATTTTNVNINEDLAKVQDNWVAQVKQFAATMREFSKAVVDAAGKVDEQTSGLQKEEILKLKDKADQAKTLVEQMAGHFSLSAFEKPFSVLTNPQGDPKAKLAAREQALRSMREYRDDVLDHPILRQLTDKSNPVGRDKLVAATGYVRAALKRIEIETLIGV